jgi:hypothetical protein
MVHAMNETGFDPNRRLCPDGSCVGLIGPDGRCTVCAQTESAAAAEDAEPAVPTAPSEGGFDPSRRLCDDGSCVGVIGPDGSCTVCGQKAGG